MFIHVLVFENNSQIGSLMLKLRLSHRADYIVYFQAHSSKWFISKETAIICKNQFGCLKCAKINNIYSKGKTTLREMVFLRGKITKLELLTIATLGKGGFGQNKESLKYFVQKRKILRNHIGENSAGLQAIAGLGIISIVGLERCLHWFSSSTFHLSIATIDLHFAF